MSGFQEFTKPGVKLPRSSPCRTRSGACTDGRLVPTVRLEPQGHPTKGETEVSSLLLSHHEPLALSALRCSQSHRRADATRVSLQQTELRSMQGPLVRSHCFVGKRHGPVQRGDACSNLGLLGRQLWLAGSGFCKLALESGNSAAKQVQFARQGLRLAGQRCWLVEQPLQV